MTTTNPQHDGLRMKEKPSSYQHLSLFDSLIIFTTIAIMLVITIAIITTIAIISISNALSFIWSACKSS